MVSARVRKPAFARGLPPMCAAYGKTDQGRRRHRFLAQVEEGRANGGGDPRRDWKARAEEAGRIILLSLFFTKCPSVCDTVAINRKSAEERLFMRFFQSVTIKQPVKY